ncbi:hypothetical protein LUZ60_007012 [Juncus effusus]|nr:hypothetical protein LUZ60_007012 [Juncus effusus]
MGARVPMQQYNMRGGNSFMGGSLHDLNTVDGRHGEMDGMSDMDREAVTEDSLDNGDESNSVDCYRNSLTLDGVGVEEEHSVLDNNSRPSSPSYNILSSQDVIPIEASRAKFLDLIVEHFIKAHVIEVSEPYHTEDHTNQQSSKRKPRDNRYEGDPRLALPLMYIANLYENLVNDVNARLSNIAGMIGVRDRTIGVALEAAGGLYRKLVNKFPKIGPISFRRRELATSQATRSRFPELVVQEEKRVRFMVINGLLIVENPNTMSMEEAHWFKRLTGRNEVAISARDYKYYSPRHKYRRSPSQPLFNIHESAAFSGSDSSPLVVSPSEYPQNNEPQNEHQHQADPKQEDHHTHQQQEAPAQQPHQHFHPVINHSQPQTGPQNAPQFNPYIHPCTLVATSSHVVPSDSMPHHPLAHNLNNSNNNNSNSNNNSNNGMMQHLACLQSITTAHLSGRVHILPTSPAKFCDECGSPYLRETSKFCSECGTKRLGI